jgi:hypothetical protein
MTTSFWLRQTQLFDVVDFQPGRDLIRLLCDS